MPLDPDLAAFLELVEAGQEAGNPPLHMLPPPQARAQYNASTVVIDSPGAALACVETLAIPCRDGVFISAKRYANEAGLAKQPALLFFHGGGYCVGGLDSHDALCRSISASTPCTVVSVDYRLAPEHRFPTAVHDAEDSYRWLLAEADALGIDAKRIAVGGDSAGGTLATVLCMLARDAELPAPLLQLLLYPCASPWQDSDSHRRLAKGYLLEAETLQWMFGNYLRSEADRRDWRFAPLLADVQGLPPALVMLAEFDPLLDEGRAYADKLAAADVDVKLDVKAGMLHDFLRLGNITAAGDHAKQDLAAYLAQAFARRTRTAA
ncbi:MAG TPA: alpha/beta hydrolase [Rhodocyclaceae bacterium]|nr:alpha/beta hydrolase [Rhodocyclaceae bacterium]